MKLNLPSLVENFEEGLFKSKKTIKRVHIFHHQITHQKFLAIYSNQYLYVII